MTLPLKYKFFLALLLTSCLVSSGMFFYIQWNFDRGFLSYVNQQQLSEMTQLAPRLAEEFARHGSWDFLLEDPQTWRFLLSGPRKESQPSGPQRAQRPPRPHPTPEPEPPPGRASHLALFDANRHVVIGPPDLKATHLKPITLGDQSIGYLALVPSRELLDAGDLLFLEQQTQSFALIALGVAFLSLLIAFPLTNQLLRPIKALTRGTRRLAAGHYQARIEGASKDELGQLCRDFNSLALTLEKNELARKQWVADIAHELRTPLSVLRGEIEALQDGIRQPDTKNLAALHGETLHLARLVDDLYELSMSDIGALSYKMVPSNPLALLEETLEQFAPRLQEGGLELDTQLDANSPVITADPGRLQQLFTNLLENSLRYTDAPGKIRISAQVVAGDLQVEVEDSAPGVGPDLLERLFERLYRGEESRNRATGGAGLGLSICRNIVEAHQGRISAGPSELGGLCIRIYFPLQAGQVS